MWLIFIYVWSCLSFLWSVLSYSWSFIVWMYPIMSFIMTQTYRQCSRLIKQQKTPSTQQSQCLCSNCQLLRRLSKQGQEKLIQ